MQVELLKQILHLVYNAMSESTIQKLSVCVARVWFIPYLNMQASYMQLPYHQHNIHSIKMVQQRVARFMPSNYDRYTSVIQMLNNIGWLTMSQRCEKLRAIMFYQ